MEHAPMYGAVLIAVFFVTVGLGVFLILFLRDSLTQDVPFVPTKNDALMQAVEIFDLKEDDALYDLGCGDARVLIAAAKRHPEAKYIGIENGWIPWLKAKWKTRNYPIQILRQDIFAADLSAATHIYCFLSIEANERLAKKMLEECRAGTKVISCDFPFPFLHVKEEIVLNEQKGPLGKKLYVYEVGRPA